MAETTNVLSKPEAFQVMRWFREHLRRRVSLDVWTRADSPLVLPDRDACTHCDDVQRLMRQLATLHPALQFTHYDLERHADRAAEAGVDLVPTTIVRSGGRSVQIVGLFTWALFPALVDIIRFASAGATPLLPSSCSALDELSAPVELEAMLASYDGYSAHLARLAGALAVESRQIRLRLIEAVELPALSGRRALTEVPLLTINGRRFTGAWDEAALVEQIRRVAAGEEEPVIRDRVLSAPYYSEEQLKELAAQQRAQQADPTVVELPSDAPPAPSATPEAGTGSSRLFIPGRD